MATLTSTGNVNLTSSTNWSPAQIPAAGDDLVIGAHTLTLDADFTGAGSLNTVSFTSTSSKVAVSGSTRVVEATNGWSSSTSNTQLINTLTTGVSLTLGGRWTPGSPSFFLVASTGGNLTLRTIGSNQSSILWNANTSGQSVISLTWTSGNLTTIGLIQTQTNNFRDLIGISGGTWTHQSSGINIGPAGNVGRLCNASGTATVNWTGSLTSNGVLGNSGPFNLTSSSTSHTIGQTGDTFTQGYSLDAFFPIVYISNGTCELTGKFSCSNGGIVFWVNGGTLRYRNQTHTLSGSENFIGVIESGSADLSGLNLTVGTSFMLLGRRSSMSVTVDANTLITCSGSGKACGYPSSNIDSKIIIPQSNLLALPSVQNVAGGTVYGYSTSPLTGTGLLVDPAILAAALQTGLQAALEPNAASIVERSTNDNKAITFSWPVSGATITGQKSIDNGAYSAVVGAITFLRTESNRHYYALAYNAADRNTVESSIRYKMTDGTYTKYFNLHVVPSGDVNVTLAPLAADQEPRNTRTRIIVYTGEAGTQYFFARDSQNNNLNLTGFNLELRFARGKSVIYTAKTTDGSLTISNGNQVNFARSSALTRGDGELTYALRDMGSGAEVLLEGPVTVRYAP